MIGFLAAHPLAAADPAATAPAATLPPERGGSQIEYRAFVNAGYRHRERLDPWVATARMIRAGFERWGLRVAGPEVAVDGGLDRLRGTVEAAAGGSGSGLSVLYLAAHHSAAGEIEFTDRTLLGWNEALGPPRRQRIGLVILDACHAFSARRHPAWSALGGGMLYASADTELAGEVHYRKRFPIDLRKRFPDNARWVASALPADWDGRISFLGFVWAEAVVRTPCGPRSRPEWARFFDLCRRVATEFGAGRGWRLASTVTFDGTPPDGSPAEAGR